MGSNPIPSIVAPVRIPDVKNNGANDRKQNLRQKPKILLERSSIVSANSKSRNRMRDIKNRKLSDWIERVTLRSQRQMYRKGNNSL